MKKIFALFLIFCLCLGLAACGKDEPDPKTPDTPEENYEITKEMIERDCTKFAPLMEQHGMKFKDAVIQSQNYDKETSTVKGDVSLKAETDVYVWSAACEVSYDVKDGQLVLGYGSVGVTDFALKEGVGPDKDFVKKDFEEKYKVSLDSVGDPQLYNSQQVKLDYTSSEKDGAKVITKTGSLIYDYDFDAEEWKLSDIIEGETKESASYDTDKTNIYDALVTNDITETAEGLVVKVYKVKTLSFKDSYIDDMRPGDVVKLSQYKSPWSGKKYEDIEIDYISENTVDGMDTIYIKGSYEGWEIYYFQQQKAGGDWVLVHEYMGDTPESGAIQYIGSEMHLLFNSSSKITKMAYFDQTKEEKFSDIRKLFTTNGNHTNLRCELRAYHGVVDWCDVHWGL